MLPNNGEREAVISEVDFANDVDSFAYRPLLLLSGLL